MFACPLHVWTPPIYLDTLCIYLDIPCMFGHPICLNTPICLDAPSMFGCPPYVWMSHILRGCPYAQYICKPPYVWMPPYIHNTKKACFVRLRGCPYTPIHLDAPICMDATHVWTPPVSLDAPICVALLATLFTP